MKLYSLEGTAKVAFCVMNVVPSYQDSGMRYVFLFLEETVWIQECR